MQCTSSLPGCYSPLDLNVIPNGGPWPVHHENLTASMSAQSYDSSYSPQIVDQFRVIYDNELLRQTMMKHELVFKNQVQQLHHLYRRHRELIDEIKMRELTEQNMVLTSQSNFVTSKISPDSASWTWHTPMAPALQSINPAAHMLSTPSSTSSLSTCAFFEILSQNENDPKNITFSQPQTKNPVKKMFNLELPADEYVDGEQEDQIREEKGSKVTTNGSRRSSDKKMNMMAFDLNMPPSLLVDSEISQTSAGPSCEREDFLVSQAFPIPIDTRNSNNGVTEIESEVSRVVVQIDLNFCFDEDEPPPTPPVPKAVESFPEIVVEAPLSPENKESMPPRGESEGNILEIPVQSLIKEGSGSDDDLVNAAAETMFFMSKSCFDEKSKASLVESLHWFAGVVSSMVDGLGFGKAGVSPDHSVDHDSVASENRRKVEGQKEESECVVALPSQLGKNERKRRRYRKTSRLEVFGTLSALSRKELSFSSKGLNCWGKVNKRRRMPRVRASSSFQLTGS